ncbi:unnamed protein product [Acanthoscelides obtectus]|uniref:Uncharacterized protein n=1 Tax=Acanthoscelides obtectus TaxID=200917 RepID=A0A9P0KA75_ACAOB|nr:unnamed protein product [Acanthoscelides obtectus]CAK1646696.1 hypothetical protein AOBTE_LOCUS14824 [Acanthoscelides obtectus]
MTFGKQIRSNSSLLINNSSLLFENG